MPDETKPEVAKSQKQFLEEFAAGLPKKLDELMPLVDVVALARQEKILAAAHRAFESECPKLDGFPVARLRLGRAQGGLYAALEALREFKGIFVEAKKRETEKKAADEAKKAKEASK